MKFFTTNKREEMELLAKEHKCIEEAFNRLDYMSQDENIRAAADARDKLWWDFEVANKAEREKGIEIGEKRGIEIGILQTAKAMLATGIPLETVIKITNLKESDLTD